MEKSIQSDKNIKNMDMIAKISEPAVSASELSNRMNKNITDEFINNPSSDIFYSNEVMKIKYPLILIKGIMLKELVAKLKENICEVENTYESSYTDSIDKDTILNFYIAIENKAKYFTTGKLSLGLLNFLDMFLLDYDIFINKGVKYHLNRVDLIDPEEFNPIILQEEEIVNYSDMNKPKENEDLSSYDINDLQKFISNIEEEFKKDTLKFKRDIQEGVKENVEVQKQFVDVKDEKKQEQAVSLNAVEF